MLRMALMLHNHILQWTERSEYPVLNALRGSSVELEDDMRLLECFKAGISACLGSPGLQAQNKS